MDFGLNAQSVAQEFLQHANEEQIHADQIARRIVHIGGAPNFFPEGLQQHFRRVISVLDRDLPGPSHGLLSCATVHNCTAPPGIFDTIDIWISESLVLGKWGQAWAVFGQSTGIT